MSASALSMTGHLTGVEPKLQAAEAALQGAEPDDTTRNLVGHIAAIRALVAAAQNQVETIIAQSRRALEYLHPDNLAVRTATIWKLGIAYQLQGDRAAASRAYSEAIAISQASGNIIINLSATVGLGNVQETENQLYPAAQTYQRVLQLVGLGRRCRLPAKRILAWPGYATNGTTWMKLRSTGSRASNWRSR
jgi:LuxR family maltose regulon positive regulatory protein